MAELKNPNQKWREVGGRNVLCSKWLWWELENTLKIELPNHVTECVITLYTQPDFLVKINCTYSPTEQLSTMEIVEKVWEEAKSKRLKKVVIKDGLEVIQIKDGKMIFFDVATGEERQCQLCTVCGGKGERHNDMHDSPDTCSNCRDYQSQGYPIGTVPFGIEQEEKT